MAYTTIDDPSAHFKVQLYTGNGGANHAITFDDTDTDMQPDLVWIKNRDATDRHSLFDNVRGATKLLSPDSTDTETTDTDTLDSFTSDGFQVDADVKVNTNAEKYVAWCWKGANGTATNTAGDINSTVSANTTSGVTILKADTTDRSGDLTMGHGLGIVPQMLWWKNLGDDGQNWQVYHIGTTSGLMRLNDTNVRNADVTFWNTHTTTLIDIASHMYVQNGGHRVFVGYVFAPVQGFSKFGSYEGNGAADGIFVYTGFRPAFVMTKSVDSTSPWEIFDNKREGYNIDNDALVADDTTVEATADQIDLLSNGFKFRIATDPNVAETYIYMAFAEAPFVNSNGVPCNAR